MVKANSPTNSKVTYPFPGAAADAAAAGQRKPGAKMSGTLMSSVDALHEIRELIRRAQIEERRMTAEVMEAITKAGTDRLAGAKAVAILGSRTTTTVDPELWLEATGKAGLVALSVSVTKARELMLPADLDAISERTETPVLTVREKAAVLPRAEVAR